ncbi:MAG: hypothetical protein HYV26_22345, partial [Candidatus Hydrogenedentes bacterium]|nr:hypothetical protein [Candidatus Hydrogenedentota bacterium]
DRVLLLPAVSALSTGEIAGMQHIAEARGRIMALGTPGLFDEHGAPRDTPPLDVLFAGDPSGAHAVLDWDDPEMLQILEDAFAEAEIGPAVPLREKGPHFLGECYQFTYGQAEILALLAGPTAEDEQRVRLSLPKDAHVYDVQTHLPVLSPKRVSARIAPGTAAVFSILPYEVEGVTLLAPGTAYAGRRLEFRVHVAVHSGAAGAHLLRIDLSPEFGEPLLPYRRFVPCAAGLGGDYLPLALNLPPGRYVLTATDLLTGLQQNAYVSIGQAPEG